MFAKDHVNGKQEKIVKPYHRFTTNLDPQIQYKRVIEVDIIFLGRKNLDDSNVSYQIVQVLNDTKIVGFLF